MKDFLQGVLVSGLFVAALVIVGDDLSHIFPLSLVYYFLHFLIYTDFIGLLICGGEVCEDMGALIHFVTFPISYGFVFLASAKILNRYTRRPTISPSRLAKIQSHPFISKMLVSLIFTCAFFALFFDFEPLLKFFSKW